MEDGFKQPQRQSSIGVLLMFVNTLQQWGRALWPIALVYVFKIDELNKAYLFTGITFFLIVIGIIAYLKYLNFTFYLDDENKEFVINEGILNKTKTIIQLNKIQQVNINQSLIQRFIGVYELDVDTAGSSKKEGRIKAISHPSALSLKASLLENEKVEADSEKLEMALRSETAEERPFMEISFLSLLKVGITSNYVKSLGLIVAFVATVFENSKNFINQYDFDDEKIDAYLDKTRIIQSVAIIAFLLISAILIINLIRVVFRYFDYKITRQNGSLLLSFGLMSTKSTIIKPEKVQIVTITRNFFQKKMNILELKIKQATSGEKEERKSVIEIPGCNETESVEILKLLFLKAPEKGIMLKPNYRKLVFSIFLSIVLPLTAYFTFAKYIEPRFWDYAYLAPLYVFFVGSIVFFGFKNNRLFINDDFIIKQSGAWDVDNMIIEPGKIQAITTSQLFWHKSADIGSITIHTAGGNIAFQLGDYSKIKQYVNLWLFELETSNSNWM
ncbi:PH domain-containing protein [Flavobacterium degerlachei]|jgi:putative membrane protein|uniref:Putative membrane protein n=1 Tax=Flavobacterium degerlachei TaxID=229203 RepID=A0A1H3BLL1_9FLAO|nr:PH domain-containing protein [Flavobacterium degerlachei]SDX42578.1 putative membrane protein [Flavobacterium degerlachei]